MPGNLSRRGLGCRSNPLRAVSSPRLPAGPFSPSLRSPQQLSLYPQDVCPRDGGAGGGDRSFAHRHEGAQVSHPGHGSLLQGPGRHPLLSLVHTPTPTSWLGKRCLFCGSLAHSGLSPPGGRREGVEGQQRKGTDETWPLLAVRIPCSCFSWPYQNHPPLPRHTHALPPPPSRQPWDGRALYTHHPIRDARTFFLL